MIVGKIQNYEKYSSTRVVGLCPQGHGYGFSREIKESKIERDGSFRIEVMLDGPEEFVLKPFFNVHIYTHPGDKIDLTIDMDKAGGLVFDGAAQEDNTKLNQYYLEGFFTHDNTPRRVLESKKPEEFLTYSDSILDLRQDLLEDFVSEYDPSDRLYKNIKALVLNNHYQQLIRYGININRNHSGNFEGISGIESLKFFNEVFEKLNDDFGQMIFHNSREYSLTLYLYYLEQLFLPEITGHPDLGQIQVLTDRVIEISKRGNPVFKDYLLLTLGNTIVERNLEHFDTVRATYH